MTAPTPVDNRRLRRLELSGRALRGSFNWTRRWFRFNLPPDIRLVNVAYDTMTDSLQLLVHSDEFSTVEPGVIVPAIDLVIETREDDEKE